MQEQLISFETAKLAKEELKKYKNQKMKQTIEIEVPEGKVLKLVQTNYNTIKYEIVDEEIKLPTYIGELDILPIQQDLYPTRYTLSLLALNRLIVLRDTWIDLTNPNWSANFYDKLQAKYCITKSGDSVNILCIKCLYIVETPLSFPTRELAERFLNTPEFQNFFKTAKPLL